MQHQDFFAFFFSPVFFSSFLRFRCYLLPSSSSSYSRLRFSPIITSRGSSINTSSRNTSLRTLMTFLTRFEMIEIEKISFNDALVSSESCSIRILKTCSLFFFMISSVRLKCSNLSKFFHGLFRLSIDFRKEESGLYFLRLGFFPRLSTFSFSASFGLFFYRTFAESSIK